jgi:flagellar L-ring protein FlgH
LWTAASRLTDIGADLRAVQINDLVTIVVNEQASAVATGATKTSRVSSVNNSVTALGGVKSKTGALANLATAAGDTELNGLGTTSQGTSLSSTLSARVTHVLPNGYLVLEGFKNVQVNSEYQEVTVRGIIRPIDLSPGNVINSSQLAQMAIRINGKGVVDDAVRRPNFLYRFILGLLPF